MAEINYPFRTFRYRVVVDGIDRGGFSEVSGMNLTTDVIEYREGTDLRNTPRKLPGLTKFGNVTLRWGVTTDQDFLTWIQSVAPNNEQGPTSIDRRKVVITLIDDAGNDGPSWEMINCWPTGYTIPDLNGTGSEAAIQSVEFCHEGLWHSPSATDAAEPSEI